MATWANLLADIRTDLKDPAGVKVKWSDDLLYLYTKDALRDYSLYFPIRKVAVLTLASERYALPADLLKINAVECPEDSFLEERYERPGRRYVSVSPPSSYHVSEGYLYLEGTPQSGTAVYLTYDAVHPIPASATATTFVITVPAMDEELIRLYVRAKVAEQTRTQQANLDRFKLGSGDRKDNPLEPETANLMLEYYAKVAERTPGGAILLWRPGRRS